MDWIKEHAPILAVGVVAIAALIATFAFYDYAQRAGADPGRNQHAKACVEAGRTIRSHNHGGRDQARTFWCVTSDGQITDLWFS